MSNGYPANNVYIGARYVPKLVGEWDGTKETAYEPLIIVTYQGNSYTSRQYVPAGIDISNTEYWVLTGNFNGQIESFRLTLEEINTKIKNTGRVSVKDYGAVGDGIADDSDAIQSALDASDFVILPHGNYRITKTLTLSRGNQHIEGDTLDQPLITFDGQIGVAIRVTSPRCYLANFRVQTSNDSETFRPIDDTNYVGIKYEVGYNFINNVKIGGFNTGIYLNNCYVMRMYSVFVQNCYYGFYGNSNFNNNVLMACSIQFCDIGLSAVGNGSAVYGLVAEHNRINAIRITNSGDLLISGGYFEKNTSSIAIEWGQSPASMATVDGCYFAAGGITEHIFEMHGNNMTRLNVINCLFRTLDDVTRNLFKLTTANSKVSCLFDNNYFYDAFITYNLKPENNYAAQNKTNKIPYTSRTMDTQYSSFYTDFTASGTLNLPPWLDTITNTPCVFCAVSTVSSDNDKTMTIANIGSVEIKGIKNIKPNTVYTAFNRGQDIFIVEGGY